LTRETIEETSTRYEGWLVAVASGVGVLVSFASLLVYTFGIFLKPLTEEFAWSRESVSAAFGIAAMTVAVCSPLLGYLLDRYSPRKTIVPCLTIFGCAFASLALLTPHLWHLYAVFLVLGIVGNGTAQMAYSRAVSSWFDRRRGTALALVMSGGALGAMVLPALAEALIDDIGWRGRSLCLGPWSSFSVSRRWPPAFTNDHRLPHPITPGRLIRRCGRHCRHAHSGYS
jgi:MFS family permease